MFLSHIFVQTSKKPVSFWLHIVTAGNVGQRFLLIKNVGKIKNVKKRVFYFKIKKRKKRFLHLWMQRVHQSPHF